jgi:MFS-type transporter involved in bile tolerance (Atg22 family)
MMYSFITSIIVKIIYLSIGYFGAISVGQLTKFLNWRKQIMIYIICWIVIFVLIKNFYSYLPKLINKRTKKKINKDLY